MPLILGGPIIFSFLKLNYFLNNQSTNISDAVSAISDTIYYGPLILFVIWLTISVIGIEKRKI